VHTTNKRTLISPAVLALAITPVYANNGRDHRLAPKMFLGANDARQAAFTRWSQVEILPNFNLKNMI